MLSFQGRSEIDHRTMKLIVGAIAVGLALALLVLTGGQIGSLSAAYHEDGLPRNLFVGCIFALSAYFAAYNGRSTFEMRLSKGAAIVVLGVALFPCACETHTPTVPFLHEISAAITFSALAVFCFLFCLRAREKAHPRAQFRSVVYVISGLTILVGMGLLGFDAWRDGVWANGSRFVFWVEFAMLLAFGCAWLLASRLLPLVATIEERQAPPGTP